VTSFLFFITEKFDLSIFFNDEFSCWVHSSLVTNKLSMKHKFKNTNKGIPKYYDENLSHSPVSVRNRTWTSLVLKGRLHNERTTANRLSHGTVLLRKRITFRWDIPVVLYRIIKYIGKIYPNTTCLMFFINNMFLHCFYQRHVSAVAMSHLQVDHFFLSKVNHTISSVIVSYLRGLV
jgi:hypothetical protein